MNGQSPAVTAINLSALSCSAKLTEGGAVEKSADIPARCATTTRAGSFGASTPDLVSGAATEPS